MNDLVKHVKQEFTSGFKDSFVVAGAIVKTVASVVAHPKTIVQHRDKTTVPTATGSKPPVRQD